MTKYLTLPILVGLFFLTVKPAYGFQVAGSSAQVRTANVLPASQDNRVKILSIFLLKYDSPLADLAETFVVQADKYGIDWRLVAAITGVESTFGQHIPLNSFNAYGWNNGLAKFNSWEESIEVVSRALGEKYYAKGLNTPAKIGPVYAPPSTTWVGKVNFFMEKISQTQTMSVPELTI